MITDRITEEPTGRRARAAAFLGKPWLTTSGFFALFVVAFAVAFSLNGKQLFVGLDGTDWTIIFANEVLDRIPFSQVGVDPLQGMFDAYFPLRHEFLLPDFFALLIGQAPAGRVATYTIYAALLLIACYLCGRSMGFARHTALFGGFLLPIACLPTWFGKSSPFYPLFALNPHLSQTVAISLLVVASFWAIDAKAPIRSGLLVFAPALGIVLAVLGNPGGIVLLVPAVAAYGGASILPPQLLRERILRIVSAALAAVVPVALGMVTYYRGLIGYTAYNFFSADFEQTRANLISASTAFWIEPYGKYAIAAGLLAATAIAFLRRNRLRAIAIIHLITTIIFFVIALVIVTFAHSYQGPSPVYFETALWPYSLLFAALLLLAAAKGITKVVASLGVRLRGCSGSSIVLVFTALALIVYDAGGTLFTSPRADTAGQFFPLHATPITDYLTREIAVQAGSVFRGFSATVDGVDDRSPIDWFTLHGHDARLWQETGNDHRIVGLKYFDIPSLFQYSTYITPPFYLMMREFLSRPADRQVRSIVLLSQVNAPLMQLWGVRYLILDGPAQIGPTVATLNAGTDSLRVEELPHPNLGNYSPTETVIVPDYRSGIGAMRAPDFDGRTRVLLDLTDIPIEGPFEPANDAQLQLTKDGLHITAQSGGRSILVLPAQYSHCWSVQGTGQPRLFRADLMQLGIAFNGSLDAKLVFRYGPILAGQCRVDDIRDMATLRVGDANKTITATANAP